MIYFDNSATTPILDELLTTYNQVSKTYIGNPSSLHSLGTKAYSLLKEARKQIANLLNVNSNEIIFTSGGTEGNNMILKSAALSKINQGKHILVSSIEHPSVIEPAMFLKKMGYDVEFIPVDKKGFIDTNELKKMIRKDTILVSVMAVNNEIGSIQPLKEIAKILENYPTLYFHIDAVQAIGKIQAKDYLLNRVDFATFSGHKFHAPRGIGFIYAKSGKDVSPLLNGGGQESNLRSGTENLPSIVTMSKALRLLLTNEESKEQEMKKLNDALRSYLSNFEKVTIYTPTKNYAPHILTFGIKGIRGEVLLHALEENDIYVSTTSACSSHKKIKTGTLQAMNVPSNESETVIRVSFSHLNKISEVEKFKEVFNKIYDKFDKLN